MSASEFSAPPPLPMRRVRTGSVLTLDRYLGSQFIRAFVGVVGVCLVITLLGIFFDIFDILLEFHPPFRQVMQYFVYTAPGDLIDVAPLLSLLGALFSFGVLAKNNEILAMHACGVSYTRLCASVFLISSAISVGVFLVTELYLPEFERRSKALEAKMQGSGTKEIATDVFKPQLPFGVLFAESYDAGARVAWFPRVFEMAPKGGWPARRIEARKASRLKTGPSGDTDIWRFEDAVVTEYDPSDGALKQDRAPKNVPSLDAELPRHVDELLARPKRPEEMDAWELGDYIRVMKSVGENPRQYATDLQHKIAFPLSCLILTLIGYTISVRAHVRPMVTGFSYGLAAGIAYYVVDAVTRNLGHAGAMPPEMAGWFPNLVFLGVAVYRLRYVNFVRD